MRDEAQPMAHHSSMGEHFDDATQLLCDQVCRRRAIARPSSPLPNRAIDIGSGAFVVPPVVSVSVISMTDSLLEGLFGFFRFQISWMA